MIRKYPPNGRPWKEQKKKKPSGLGAWAFKSPILDAQRDDRGECEEETNKKWKESEDEVGRREGEENMNEE